MKGMLIPILVYSLELTRPRNLLCQVNIFWVLAIEIYESENSSLSDIIVILGGEDCNLRIWSIKSGELLFEDKFSKSVPSTVCWRRAESIRISSESLVVLFLFYSLYRYVIGLIMLRCSLTYFIFPVYKVIVFNSCVGLTGLWDERKSYKEYQQSCSMEAWLGTHEGLFYMHWSWAYSVTLISILSVGGEIIFLKTASPQTCKALYCLWYGWHSNDNANIGPLCAKSTSEYHLLVIRDLCEGKLWRNRNYLGPCQLSCSCKGCMILAV